MNRANLQTLAFLGWLPLGLAEEDRLMGALPSCFGVYAFVFPEQQVRRTGTSDIAYIGSAKNQGGLRHRIRGYFHPGYDNRTNIRMQQHMGDNPVLFVGYCDTGSDRAKLLESDLLL